MTQQLRKLAALEESLDSVPSTYMADNCLEFQFQRIFWSSLAPGLQVVHRHTHRQSRRFKKSNKNKFIFF